MTHRCTLFFASLLAALTFVFASGTAHARDLSIREVTKYYSISGKTASEFARSMSRRGPYSLQHRSRAWATASRDLSYQLVRRQSARDCRIKAVKVRMKITYTLPKLRSTRGIRKSQRNRWRKMVGLLDRHEKTHGRFYKEFAKDVRRKLLRMGPARNCGILDRNASAIVAKLNEKDRVRNARFDRRDGRNYSRMTRLYNGS